MSDPTLEARRKASIEDLERLRLFREVEFIPIDANALQKLYQQAKNAISRDFIFAERTVIPEIKGVNEAYLGLLPAKDFLHLIEDEDGELIKSIFYDNVRDWQDYNTVNAEIRDTLTTSDIRSRFALMNNGITLIAKTLRSTGNKIHLEDYQVVNGCQTSHVLHDQREHLDSSVFVPLRIISTRDESIIGSIIKATNRQTEVKEEQLLALSDFQKKLEQYFQTFPDSRKLFYERRSRQFNSVQGVEKTRIVTPGNLIRAYASMFRDEPHRTTRTYRALLANVGTDIFGANHRLEPYYAAAYALYCLEYLFRSQALDAKYKPARWHLLLAVRILLNRDQPPRPNSHDMQRYAEGLMETLWETDKTNAVFQRAAVALAETAQGNFHRDHIRTEPFTNSLKKACDAAA
jgi:hypothetical protein